MTDRLPPVHGPHRHEAVRPIPWEILGEREILLVLRPAAESTNKKGTDTP